jgi:hypothetical protein
MPRQQKIAVGGGVLGAIRWTDTTPPGPQQTVGQRRYVPSPKPQPKPKVTTTSPPKVDPPKVSGTTPATPTRVKPDPVTARPTGAPSEHDADVLAQQGARRQIRAYPSAHQHHIFPQALRAWFEERFGGLKEDIDEYTVYLSEGEHTAVHSKGKGGSVRVRGEGGTVQRVKEPDLKGWNQEWEDFKRKYGQATPEQIFEEGGRLMDKYGISEAEIVRYGSKNK